MNGDVNENGVPSPVAVRSPVALPRTSADAAGAPRPAAPSPGAVRSPAAPNPAAIRANHEPLEGIHDLPIAEQIRRFRTLHDELASQLASERD